MTGGAADPFAIARRVAGYGLSRPEDEPSPLRMPPGAWQGVLAYLVHQRLTGLAVAAARSGWFEITDAQAEGLLGRHREAMALALSIERRLLDLSAAFSEAAVEFIVLKGPAVAHTFYPDPSWRAFGDLDILVRTRDWRRACALLSESGFRRELPEPRPGFDERFGKAATHVDGDGLQVDLHRTLVLGPFGLWLEPDGLFERSALFLVGGCSLRRLDDTTALLNACLHASLGSRPARLLPVRDVAQIAAHGDVDWEDLGQLARSWRLHAAVRHAFAEASARLGVAPPEEARSLLAVEPAARERRALQAYTTDRRRRGGPALSAVRAIPGLRAKGSYLLALLFPDAAFLRARAGTDGLPTYLRRWMVPIRWLTGGRR